MPTPTPIALIEARASGASRYFTGVPCVNGHLAVRKTENQHCTDCDRERDMKRSGKKKIIRNTTGKQKQRAYDVKSNYGLSFEELSRMHKEQNECCPLCLNPFTSTPCVDHCHETGKVRGLLCRRCNTMLGQARDNVETLARAIEYLNR